ncbi:3-hydroxy-3-methylglutaryl-coenzyme A (HMG-CoA) reductase isozyme [Aspergillus puulaauensis]|uniref:3-hydroxy-3-methylglutaryl coenzyme A reductase n=1 Tax=Aspergillus puulaauensis TaxID=1220207 RepID=A0A7R8AIN7_9EURO|nr:3-hydroxy-3-methylglutaryl-coenzyme A (HMG-CoA) reductase isozyme [Aspergillus puulaauensis]BCS19647.1 3-hydroxy-3-methylglutaryl-coenzyme A (HMG-CoA) reductase isozyme [Aspergillus puulaauensis]
MAVGTISPGHNKKPEQLNAQQSWHERILSIPQRLSSIASARPVHTIGLVSLLVSSAYVALLENSLLDVSKQGHQLQETPRHFYTGPDTTWQWHSRGMDVVAGGALDHRALVRLEFGHLSNDIPTVSLPDHLSVDRLPSSLDSPARSLAFSVAQRDVSEFLDLIHKSPVGDQSEEDFEGHKWVIKTQDGSSRRGITQFARDKWTELVYLFNHTAPLDIAIMAAAYIAMHLTFVSLFLSMYRMGSRFWLFAGVLISSTFAFLFALFTTTRLGVRINLALLSEGLPFLVVVIGFENPVKFTQAVLRHATTRQGIGESSIIQTAIDKSIKNEGPKIIKHYVLEIAAFLAGSLLSIDPALRQFCFLAAWILFFDCINLFSFYTAILCTKLEIIRIQTSGKEHRPQARKDRCTTVFGQQLSRTHIRKFKLGMVAAFILVNVLNMTMIPFRITTGSPSLSSRADSRQTFPGLHTHLKAILDKAAFNERATLVSILPPVRFELASPENEGIQTYGVDSLLKSLEDPVLVKCVLVALVISVALNGRLFAAARCGVKDENTKSDTKGEYNPSKEKSPQKPLRSESDDQTPLATKSVQEPTVSAVARTEAECQTILKGERSQDLTDEEVISLSLAGKLPLHALEKTLKDFTRAVKIRRSVVSRTKATIDLTQSLEVSDLPYESYDWSRVFGVCCENVVGYTPVPVGLAGPLTIDNKDYFLPMATTEGVLVAGVMRGSKAINAGGGAKTVLTADGMTRGPCVSFESLDRAADAKKWLDSIPGQDAMKAAFNSTTRYGRLESMKTAMAGTTLYIRFKASTGDAMGMNMISKGVEHALNTMRGKGFGDMDIVSLSANYCSDKKPAAINWIDGRGKSVVAQATIAPEIVKSVLKTDVESMVALNTDKNLIGSAMAGSIGGFNAHAANIVAAMYIATGQDPAQVVESANSITIMKNVRGSLQISVSMPSIEVGTIGGGTTLGPQRAMLDILGVRGANADNPGENARSLARVIAAGTLAAELSLCAALAAGHLVRAHMQHNRASQ